MVVPWWSEGLLRYSRASAQREAMLLHPFTHFVSGHFEPEGWTGGSVQQDKKTKVSKVGTSQVAQMLLITDIVGLGVGRSPCWARPPCEPWSQPMNGRTAVE